MSKDEKQLNIQYITCPKCGGTEKDSRGRSCANCALIGLAGFYQGRFFYWGNNLTKAIIKLKHLKRGLDLALNVTVYTIGIIGLSCLAWWVWLGSNQSFSFGAFAFWRMKSLLILIFWLSVVADMFVIYRLSKEEAAKQKIIKPKYDERIDLASVPNNWAELKKVKAKYKIDVSASFNFSATKVVEDSFILTTSARHGEVRIVHLFFNLLKDNGVAAVFSRLNVNGPKLISKIKNQLLALDQVNTPTRLSGEVKEALIEAYLYGLNFGQKKVEAYDLILPCLTKDKNLEEILYDLDINWQKIYNVIQWFNINQRLVENYRHYHAAARFKPATAMDRAYTAVATPVLNHFAHDLTISAKWGRLEICVGREKEIEKIFETIKSGKYGIILVGPNGVGKNTIIGQLAQLMVEENVPRILKDKRLVELDVARLVSGAAPAQAEERLLVILDEVAKAGNIALYINNIENLMGITSGGEQSLDLSEVLANALERRELISLATATDENFTKYLENKPLGNAMTKVDILEPEINQAIQMVESKIGFFEAKYKIYFSYSAVAKAVELTGKYIHDKQLPAKAIDVLETIAVKVSQQKGVNCLATEDDIAAIISEMTRIPITKVTESEGEVLLKLEDTIHERMIDQEEAVIMVAASLRRARTELRESKRPIANFLFLGPTGVGKTELAKTVAEVYFGREDYMIRVDMSEYQYQDSIEKMIGGANGTLGYLTEAVRKTPFSLILLDEFEKAHPDILNLFLQVMDDGRLTDGQGRTIDFTNSIIIATSNVGAVFIQEQIKSGTDIAEIKQKLVDEQLNKVLRPELINRFDGVIVFKPLTLGDVAKITSIMLNKVKKILEAKGIKLEVDPLGVNKLAELGFDPKFGARPLRRVIQEQVENKIADKILAGEIKRRDTVIIDQEAKVEVRKGKKL